MRQVIRDLEQLRQRSRVMLVVQRLAVLVSWIVGVGLALILLDYLLRLPSAARLVMLVAGLGGVGWFIWEHVRTAVLFRPSLTQMALRVERVVPVLAGRLASSVEFVTEGVDASNPLAARTVMETTRRIEGEAVDRTVLRPGRTVRDVAIMLVVVAGVAVLAVNNPAAASKGVRRLVMPYGAVDWPARTGARSLMDEVLERPGVHRRGQALRLRAEVTKGPLDQRVDAYYRYRTDGAIGPWERIVLTDQGNGVHERLVDTNADRIEIEFVTEDARTKLESIELVPAPAVVRAVLEVTPPAYASGRTPKYTAELGPGIDDRAITDTASLVGSSVRLSLELNKALPVPERRTERDAWVRRTLGWDVADVPALTVDDRDERLWDVRWMLRQDRSLDLQLVDDYGLTNAEPIGYRIKAAQDRPPSVTITDPETDESVLATAIVPLAAEAHDDVAVALVAIQAAVARADDSTIDVDVPAIVTDDEAITRVEWETQQAVDAVSGAIGADLDLSELQVAEGDVVLVVGLADDQYEADGVRHPTVRSMPRRLRIISELEFATQLRRQLSAVRQNAIRIESIQAELQDDVIDQGVQPGLDRAQAQISERIASQREIVEDIDRQMQNNLMNDAPLSELLDRTSIALDLAGRAGTSAVEAIQRRAAQPGGAKGGTSDAGGAAPQDPGGAGETEPAAADPGADLDDDMPPVRAPAEADREVVDRQQDVRDELVSLIELLDRDEDTWVVTRQLEGLLDEQTRLEAETRRLGRRTVGMERDELSEEDRRELDRIAARQRDLRDEARRIVEQLRRRADAAEETDPQSAASMRAAADTAEQQELDRDMDSAAERTEQNQMRGAAASQRSAGNTIRRMLEDIQEGKRARAEELLRKLASLIESIERLINIQKQELEALAEALDTGDFIGRDRVMIRLNQNTLAVAGEARAAGQQTRRIARSLDRAADAQGAAVTALRARPVLHEQAEEAEQHSLELLEEAKRMAEELQQQTQEEETQRKREELMEAYRAFAEAQRKLRAETLTLAEVERLDRRQMVEARRFGDRQEDIRTGLQEMRDVTQELLESPVFSLAHRRIDGWSHDASDSLWASRVDVDVTDRQLWIADSIDRLLTALEESLVPPEEFEQGEDSPSGGQPAQQGLIPPVAELKLLHGLQDLIYNQTRDLDQRTDLEGAQRRDRHRALGQEQREVLDLSEEILERLRPAPPVDDVMPPVDESEPEGEAMNGRVSTIVLALLAMQETAGDPQEESSGEEGDDEDSGEAPPPNLDELLGIEEEDKGPGGVDADSRDNQAELQRELDEVSLTDAFELAIQKMSLSADLLDIEFDSGLGTQRVQEEILARLDQMIEQARQMSKMSMSSSSSSSGQQSDPMSDPGRSQAQGDEQQTENRGSEPSQGGDPPGRREGDVNSALDETRTEWGALPQRYREMMEQGRGGSFSSLYRRLTEEYYRRLAEEGSS